LDSPVDAAQEMISPVLDQEAMRRLRTVDETGEEISWRSLNHFLMQEFQSRLRSGAYEEEVAFLNATERMRSPDLIPKSEFGKTLKAYLWGIAKYELSPKWRKELNIVGTYLHGTHVAGLVVQSSVPPHVKLITCPVIGVPDERIRLSEILNSKDFLAGFAADSIKKTDAISRALKEARVKVVNMSIGSNSETLLKKMRKQSSFFARIFLSGKMKEMAEGMAKIGKSEDQRLFNENPQTVFVLAAGNEQMNLSTKGMATNNTATAKAKNLVVVGAIDSKGNLAKFSNYGSDYVDVAALGVSVQSAKVNGGKIYLSGTSMATPVVSNKLADIAYENPELSAEEIIQELLTKQTHSSGVLEGKVAGGRFLPVDEKLLGIEDPAAGLSGSIDLDSGALAEILEKNPQLKPDDAIKKLLEETFAKNPGLAEEIRLADQQVLAIDEKTGAIRLKYNKPESPVPVPGKDAASVACLLHAL
jgi:subtilisin family serine protease